jgi:site-specific DNA-methyltransferase (adenine-specific)
MPAKKNSVLAGDCFHVLDSIPDGSVDLIYLDPPFFSQRKHQLKVRKGDKTYEFQDEWTDIQEYIQFLKLRVEKCRRKLKDSGSLFLHCDRSASHYLKVMLDEIFGYEQFQSEIIWSYKRWSNSKKGLLPSHQSIFFYSKTSDFKFNQFFEDYSPATNVDQILQLRGRDSRNKSVYQKDESGNSLLAKSKKGVPLGDVWDIPFLNPKAKERVSYPTQKPILLLEKIILLVTDAGDAVLDPFCGSGSTLVAAHMLRRSFIGIDCSQDAVDLALSRLTKPYKTESNLLKRGRDSYNNQNSEIAEAVRSVGGVVVQRNKGIDGILSTAAGVVPFKVVLSGDDLEKCAKLIAKSSSKNKYVKKALLTRVSVKSSVKNKIEKNYGVILFADPKSLADRLND